MGKSVRPLKVHEDLIQLKQFIEDGDENSVKTIIKNHGIDAYDEDKRSALIWATIFGEVNILKWLLKNGANLDHQDKNGYTGLHFCGQEKLVDSAALLLESGADPNIKDEHDNSPLWTALFNAKGDFKTVKLLISYNADTESKNRYGRSPNDMAKTIYKMEIKELIN